MNEVQQQVQEAIDRLVESGAERGLQVAVYRHGEPVVDHGVRSRPSRMRDKGGTNPKRRPQPPLANNALLAARRVPRDLIEQHIAGSPRYEI